ncbi:MAG: DUF669 domain-containing protein [Patescibacteria group bacterium]|nr:DUF669 domain-containing protein [Patescibacteria group bacterium]
MAKSKRGSDSGKVVTVDLSNTETRKRVKPGDYKVAVESVESGVAKSSGKPKMSWTFKIVDGPSKGSKLFYNTSLQPQTLWNLRSVLEALGFTIPDTPLKLNLDKLKGLEAMVTVDEEEFNGKKRARIVDIYSLTDEESSEESEEDGDSDDDEDDDDDEDEDED